MNYLIRKNYESIVKRGLIVPGVTTMPAFIMKLEEEVQEFIDAYQSFGENDLHEREELADIVLVCLNIAAHYDWDIESDLFAKIEKNEQRTD